MWLAINSQWRVGGLGILVGLDYPAVYQTAAILGIEMTPAMLSKIQALEAHEVKRFADKMPKGGEGHGQ